MIQIAIAAAAALASVLINKLGQDAANRVMDQARDEFGRLDAPKLQELSKQYLSPSEFESVQQDPELQSSMRGALSRMRGLEEQGGLTLADRSAENEALDAAAMQERGQRAAIQNSFQARGAGGSSQAMLAQLQNQQGSAQAAQRAGMNSAANSQQRYWQSVRDRFGMSAQANAQDLAQKNTRAGAIDAQKRWNGQMGMTAAQNDFNNRLAIAKGKLGVAQDQAGGIRSDASSNAQTVGAFGNAGAQYASEYGSGAKPLTAAPVAPDTTGAMDFDERKVRRQYG